MKANELMIGDWVLAYEHPIQVEVIYNNRHIQANCIELDEGEFEPIPLTPEILEKNGFKQVDKGGEICIRGEYVWGDKGKRNFTVIRITYYKGLSSGVNLLTKIETDCSHDSGINMVHSCDIEYVHELQHALKLCGIEKEIIL